MATESFAVEAHPALRVDNASARDGSVRYEYDVVMCCGERVDWTTEGLRMYALTDKDFRMPVIKEDCEVAITTSAPTNVADVLGSLGLARALADQSADDLTLELDATPNRLHLRIRAYRNQQR
jgi:hypothetical protein